MFKILNTKLFNNVNRNIFFNNSRNKSFNAVPHMCSAGTELEYLLEKCRKWKSYNKKKYPPLAPGETRPAFVCHVKETFDYSYKKMWYVASFVRGMSITEALKQLQFVNLKGAVYARETLLEAQKMAVEDHNVEFKTNLWVSESFVGKANTKKIPVKYGRGVMGFIKQQNIHYFVTLEEGTPPEHYYYHRRPKTSDEMLQEWFEEMRGRTIIGGL